MNIYKVKLTIFGKGFSLKVNAKNFEDAKVKAIARIVESTELHTIEAESKPKENYDFIDDFINFLNKRE